MDEEVQADFPELLEEETELKIKPLERIKLHPKVPIEPSAYGKGKNFSRPWILQDGREVPGKGSEMRDCYKIPKKPHEGEGIRKRMLTDFFWEQMLDEVIEELATSQPIAEYCSEYDANYVKDKFEPRNLEVTADKNMHLKYPLYGTGSSAITFYSENMQKTGPGEILEKFRRCQYFTKPMEERLDNGWLERIKLHPKVPIEPSAYGKGKNFSRPWILQDGREVPGKGSEMRDCYKIPKKPHEGEGIRKRMLTDFFWEQMLDEVIEELATSQPIAEYCSEYDANYVKDKFEPRNLEVTADKNMHLKYPLYGTGSSAITFYSENMQKTGPGEILEKFRRCQYFTKPMEERLDNGWVL